MMNIFHMQRKFEEITSRDLFDAAIIELTKNFKVIQYI